MKPHVRNYYRHHNLAIDDWVGCKVCGTTAVDIHHIEGRGARPNGPLAGRGGKVARKQYDSPSNLIALCRGCHERAHANKFSKTYLKALI